MSIKEWPEIKLKQCNGCLRWWDEEAFFNKNLQRDRNGNVHITTRTRCLDCELTARNKPATEARARRKANDTIALHARKTVKTEKEFVRLYDWRVDRMIHDIMQGYETTCPDCNRLYKTMSHGLADITLDVIYPDKEPYYGTNVRWCCTTCNRQKSNLPPEIWERRKRCWRQADRDRERLRKNPLFGLPLFNQTQRTFFSLAALACLGASMWLLPIR